MMPASGYDDLRDRVLQRRDDPEGTAKNDGTLDAERAGVPTGVVSAVPAVNVPVIMAIFSCYWRSADPPLRPEAPRSWCDCISVRAESPGWRMAPRLTGAE
jgi:hypothetical protein